MWLQYNKTRMLSIAIGTLLLLYQELRSNCAVNILIAEFASQYQVHKFRVESTNSKQENIQTAVSRKKSKPNKHLHSRESC